MTWNIHEDPTQNHEAGKKLDKGALWALIAAAIGTFALVDYLSKHEESSSVISTPTPISIHGEVMEPVQYETGPLKTVYF